MSKAYISNIVFNLKEKNKPEQKVVKTVLPENIIFKCPSSPKSLNEIINDSPTESIFEKKNQTPVENKIELSSEKKSETPSEKKVNITIIKKSEISIEKVPPQEIKAKLNLKFINSSDSK